MNKKQNRSNMPIKQILLIVCSVLTISGFAQNKYEQANDAYNEKRYEDAISLYQAFIDEKGDADSPELACVFYNLGNAQYRKGEIAQAILAYERALRLDPKNEDAQYNLNIAKSKIIDNVKEENTDDFFLSVWVQAIRNSVSKETWLITSIILFSIALIGILLFFLGKQIWLRKTSFHCAWIALLFSLISGINAFSANKNDTLHDEAIIMQGIVDVKSAPDISSESQFSLHEGTKVSILGISNEWANVRIGENEGWIQLNKLERI